MTREYLTVLGIETSCDETAASVVQKNKDGSGTIKSNIIRTQLEEHKAFGGVVPEIAARAHTQSLSKIIQAAMLDAECEFKDLDAISATAGPGLIGGLLVGTMTAKAIAAVHKIPYIPVNHLKGHALTAGLTDNIRPPYLLLLVSGGHTQLIWVETTEKFIRLGSTIDDALGEAFDKTAKLLGLAYPGGPKVEQWAKDGDPERFKLPIPLKGHKQPNFSFSGLKTALRQQAETCQPLEDQDIHDLCASFQSALIISVMDRIKKALPLVEDKFSPHHPRNFVVAGGVAANQHLRSELETFSQTHNLTLTIPPAALCTDNAAMIAWAGAEQMAGTDISATTGQHAHSDKTSDNPLNFPVRARWPLDETAEPVLGSGKSGAKA